MIPMFQWTLLLVAAVQFGKGSDFPIGDGYSKLAHCLYISDHKDVFTLHNLTNFYYSINFTYPNGTKSPNETFHFNPCENVFIRHNNKTQRNDGYFCKSNAASPDFCSDYYSYQFDYLEKASNITQINKKERNGYDYYEVLFQLPRSNLSYNAFNLTMSVSCNIKGSDVEAFFGDRTIIDSSRKFVFDASDIDKLLDDSGSNESVPLNYTIHMATALKCHYENYYIGNEFFYICTPTRIISAVVFLLMAVYYLIFSLKFINITYILSSGLAFGYLAYSFTFNYAISFRSQSLSEKKYVIICVLSGFVVGVLLGLVFTRRKFQKVNTFIMNAGTGLMFALLLYHAGLKYLVEHVDTTYWVTIILFVFSFGLLSNYYETKLFFELVSSAFIGGYLLVRSVSMFIGVKGGFHNDAIIYDLSFWKENVQYEYYTPLAVYMYIGGWVIATALSCVIQRKNMNPSIDDE